ncbi:hypothetical protein [Pseudomonas sp. H9]|uniref:pilus assembly PilX family protein n=1 Tax=Pseudomonas sp. H9 TaxID=483968 RepID=UPI001057FF29|nr:hypothetical protein [Pseudomonas sp. H9]TDF80266.1 hypothetical protein E1573_20130 [Pseudomonas sp. H9]
MTPHTQASQQGVVLLLSLTLVLLLGLLGLSAMGSATQQERMARNLTSTLQAFKQAQLLLQHAEARALGLGGPLCGFCLPPPEAAFIRQSGVYAGKGLSSGLAWQAADGGFYLIQSLGQSSQARTLPVGQAANLYRITVVARSGTARSVLETVVAQPVGSQPPPAQRILWRQLY